VSLRFIRKLHGLPELPVDFSETHTICGIGAAPQELLSKKQRALEALFVCQFSEVLKARLVKNLRGGFSRR
jgi:hypothetical protein